MKKTSRLKFTEEELSDPVIGKAAKKAEKAAAKADKAQQKIPQKKQVKAVRTSDPETGKVKVNLSSVLRSKASQHHILSCLQGGNCR